MMSDFLYTSERCAPGKLARLVEAIPGNAVAPAVEFHGSWGSLAVAANLYRGFAPIETSLHVCAVIGGPLLLYSNNSFLVNENSSVATLSIYNRLTTALATDWGSDLSGPFAIIMVNKVTGEVVTITDMMAFIPLFKTYGNHNYCIGTHVDIVASCGNVANALDTISISDFILNGVVTAPYTFYTPVRQLPPATITHHESRYGKVTRETRYWTPVESYMFKNKIDAAITLREGLRNYLHEVTRDMPKVAVLLSGGEDSRAVFSMLPSHLGKDAFVFTDSYNIEARIASKVATIHGGRFSYSERPGDHYLQNFRATSFLSGSGGQFHHLHSYGFHERCNLASYHAVFGGFSSDALVKASHTPLKHNSNKYPRLMQVPTKIEGRPLPKSNYFKDEVLREISSRRAAHLDLIKQYRDLSATEWFELWPASMNTDHPFLSGNRRLFRSYEPFTSTSCIKVSAGTPQDWKLNRGLFYITMKPMFKPTRMIPHADGWFPWWPWWANIPVKLITWMVKVMAIKFGLIDRNQGPWWDWKNLWNSPAWRAYLQEFNLSAEQVGSNTVPNPTSSQLTNMQKLNLFQVNHFFNDLLKRLAHYP